jgi:hypothetical protein
VHTNKERRNMSCDWTQIKTEYITDSKSSYRKLAEKYGVPFATLRRKAKEEEWPKLRVQAEHKVSTKAINRVIDQKVDRATRLMNVTDKLLTKIEETVEELSTASVVLDKSTLKQISGALKDIKDIQGIKSDRDIREQEARIRNLEKQAEDDANKDTKITVQLEGDISKWSK